MTRNRAVRVGCAAALLVLLLAITGCPGNTSTTSPTPSASVSVSPSPDAKTGTSDQAARREAKRQRIREKRRLEKKQQRKEERQAADVTKNAIGSTQVEQGARYWAVYLATGTPNSGAIKEAEATVDKLGIASSAGPVDCDRGADKVLDLGARDVAVGVYFVSETDATAFADSLSPAAAGVGKVKTYCAD